jgi:hypothetical protein
MWQPTNQPNYYPNNPSINLPTTQATHELTYRQSTDRPIKEMTDRSSERPEHMTERQTEQPTDGQIN